MDTQPERFKDEGRRVEIYYDGEKAFFRGTVKKYSAGKQTHSILFDDGEKLAICLLVRPTFAAAAVQRRLEQGLGAHTRALLDLLAEPACAQQSA